MSGPVLYISLKGHVVNLRSFTSVVDLLHRNNNTQTSFLTSSVLYTILLCIPCLSLFWCPYMVINISVQYNGGLLPDIILSTLCDYIGEPF